MNKDGKGAIRVYIKPEMAQVFEKFTIEEIYILLTKGNIFFEHYCKYGKAGAQFLEENPEFDKVLDKW